MRLMSIISAALLCTSALSTVHAQDADKQIPDRLVIGDKAPEMSIDGWIKGTGVESFAPGKVYVVEFWATWCPPCVKSIPHLTQLQNTYGDAGLTVIGVAASERGDDASTKLAAFVERKGDQMNYTVGYDADRSMGESYMAAARKSSIPTAFVIDRDGLVAWIGNPFDGMHDVVAQVMEGKWDTQERAAAAREDARIEELARPIIMRFQAARKAGDDDGAMAALDDLVELDPVRFSDAALHKFKFLVIDKGRTEDGYAFAKKMIDTHFNENAEALNYLAWIIAEDIDEDARDLDVALQAADRAASLTESEPDASVIDTLARVHFRRGDVATAVSLQERAVSLAQDGAIKQQIQARLDEYKRILRDS